MVRFPAWILWLFLAQGCTSMADSLAKGALNETIRKSSVVENLDYRLKENSKGVHENRREMELFMESLNYINKIVDGRLAKLESRVEKILEAEEKILDILRRKKLIVMSTEVKK